MNIRRLSAALMVAAIVPLVGASCVTEEVDFPLKNCTVIEVPKKGRCTHCPSSIADAYVRCEELVCKYKPSEKDAGGSGLECKFCYWSEHPDEPCAMCWDGTGKLVKDTCHGQSGGV